jgi:hypothetical protein
MSVDYTVNIPEPMEIQDILHDLREWEYTMYYELVPEHIKEEIAVKLFTDTPASGDKGIQEDIIQDLCDKLRIDQLYNMGLINERFLRTLYQAYIEYEDGE